MGFFSRRPKGPTPVDPNLPDGEWSAASATAYREAVQLHYGNPETMADGGRAHMRIGDPGVAVYLLAKSIDMLHTAYDFSQMRDRTPGPRDEAIIQDFLSAVAASYSAHPGANLDEPVREVTHRLRVIAFLCDQRGLPSQTYRSAHDRLGDLAPQVPTHDILSPG